MSRRSVIRLRPWLLAVTLLVVSMALQHVLRNLVAIGSMGVLYPMAFLAAWYLPEALAVTVTLAGGLGALLTFYPPFFHLTGHPSVHYFRVLVFLVNAFVVQRIIVRSRRADRELLASHERLREANRRLSDANARLHESNSWYESLARATRDVVWNWKVDGDVLEFSEALVTELGYPKEKCRTTLGWWLDQIHPADRERVEEGARRVLDGSATEWSDEYRFRRGDGTYATIFDRGVVMRDGGGHVVRVLGAMQDTTERTNALRELERLQARFEAVSKATGLGVWYSDLPADELIWNDRVKEHFWMEPDQKVHMEDFFRHVHPEDRREVSLALEAAVRDGAAYDIEYRTVRPGHVRPFKRIRAIGQVLRDENGKPTRFDGITLDLTEKYQREQERIAAQREAADLLERTTDGFFTVDRNWRVTYANPVMQAFLHLSGRDIAGKTLQELMPSGDLGAFLTRFRRIAESGNPERFEETYEGRTLQLHAYQLNNRGVAVFYRDVTEQRRAETAARQSERQLREYADAMPQMAFIADGTGSIIYFNHRWYEYTDTTPGSEGWGWKDLPIHHPDDLPITLERWMHSIRTGEPYEIEYRLRRYDGKYRWHLGRAVPCRDEQGRIVRWYGTNTDIHEVFEAREALKGAINARDTFLSIASHELRTPITGMKLRTQLMRRKVQRGDESVFDRENVVKLVEQVDEGLDRMNRLVEDMLDISRIQGGRLRLHVDTVDLMAVVRHILERFESQLSQASIPVLLDGADGLLLSADRFRLEQVLTNLVTNAIRYAPGKPLRVKVFAENGIARVVMQDGGPGIPKIDQERIFRRFERLVSADNVSGLGIGLYIASEIVRAHRGSMRAEGEAGEGARFVVELPMASPSEAR